jgi:AAA+ superfamily predicted ATPase
MTDMPNFSDADISSDEREFTVDQILASQEPESDNQEPLPVQLSVEAQIVQARTNALSAYELLEDLLAEALHKRKAAQEDINDLREAMVVWEPIHNRLSNGPARRPRNAEVQEELGD